jgi:hypothetical protein
MGKTAGRLVVLGAVLAAIAAGASCALGPQPEPPGASASNSPGVGGAAGAAAGAGGAGSPVIGGSGGSGFNLASDASVPGVADSDSAREQDAKADAAEEAEVDGGDGGTDLQTGDD